MSGLPGADGWRRKRMNKPKNADEMRELLGKTIFSTRKEAEKALAEMEDKKNG